MDPSPTIKIGDYTPGDTCTGEALETPFLDCTEDGFCTPGAEAAKVPLQQLCISVPKDADVANIQFVLRSADRSKWYRDGASNFSVPIATRSAEAEAAGAVNDPLVREIINSENNDKWTLMHRFNRAADLLEEVLAGTHKDVTAAAAAIFVWLRFSSARHLAWQRNYNTQPRILSAAQARLTDVICRAHGTTAGESQEWVRFCAGCEQGRSCGERHGMRGGRGSACVRWHEIMCY
jgi:alpha-glucan, water dikinase